MIAIQTVSDVRQLNYLPRVLEIFSNVASLLFPMSLSVRPELLKLVESVGVCDSSSIFLEGKLIDNYDKPGHSCILS